MTSVSNKRFSALFSAFLLSSSLSAFADDGSDYPSSDAAASEEQVVAGRPLSQFPQPETAPIAAVRDQARVAAAAAIQQDSRPSVDFPKVQTSQDEELAKRFSWWPTDAKPAPVKDENRSGYWWWPEIPGEARPWGNQGFVYVRKIIFDYKSSEGTMKPSLVIKRVLKNVKVFFDFDKSDLRDDAQNLLTRAMNTLRQNPKADILITGAADVRGSEQYNLKLGEKRAAAVRQFMVDQGLPEDRIRILSRGKLDAMAPTNDIVGMQKDRNAQFMIAEVEEVMIPADKAEFFRDKILQEKMEFASEVKVETRDYVIQSGDTLWGIAKREYGDGMQWRRIYQFNKDVIANPDKPKKGTKIKIPIE